MRSSLSVFFCVLVTLSAAGGAQAFMKDGCGSGECRDCHTLSREEAASLLGNLVDNVVSVEESPVRGLWVVDVLKDGRKWPVYIDYSKDYVISGQVLQLSTKRNYSGERFQKLNKADFGNIPLAGSIVVGKASAPRKIFVFDNPDCPHCGHLHAELKKFVAKNPDVAFYVKLLPGGNPQTAEKARSIMCGKNPAALLDEAFAGKELPTAPTPCRNDILDENVTLANGLGIRATPTLVLPDGTTSAGYMDEAALEKLIKGLPTAAAEAKPSAPAKVPSAPAGGKKKK
jgi:thiol:disulfide interchange protein DsbC